MQPAAQQSVYQPVDQPLSPQAVAEALKILSGTCCHMVKSCGCQHQPYPSAGPVLAPGGWPRPQPLTLDDLLEGPAGSNPYEGKNESYDSVSLHD